MCLFQYCSQFRVEKAAIFFCSDSGNDPQIRLRVDFNWTELTAVVAELLLTSGRIFEKRRFS